MLLKPAIKLAGSKTKLVSKILKEFPQDFSKKQWTYIEPFVGGGSVLLAVLSNYHNNIKVSHVNDINLHIAKLWSDLRQNPSTLVESLKQLDGLPKTKKVFLDIKNKFNSVDLSQLDINHTAEFIYLSKSCFNGLIRFNKGGEFNSPYGNYNNPIIFDKENIQELNKKLTLRDFSVESKDFQTYIEEIISKKLYSTNTICYLDPPYLPLSLTSSFTSYSPGGFSLYDHRRLRLILDLLTEKKIKFILSNSYTDMTKEIFNGYNFIEILTKRTISARSSSRGEVKEFIIKNF